MVTPLGVELAEIQAHASAIASRRDCADIEMFRCRPVTASFRAPHTRASTARLVAPTRTGQIRSGRSGLIRPRRRANARQIKPVFCDRGVEIKKIRDREKTNEKPNGPEDSHPVTGPSQSASQDEPNRERQSED